MFVSRVFFYSPSVSAPSLVTQLPEVEMMPSSLDGGSIWCDRTVS